MKVIASLPKGKFLCEFSSNEINLMAGQPDWKRVEIGDSLDIEKQWKALEHARFMVHHKEVIEESYRRALKLVSDLKLENLEKEISE
jgi:hypothetical protein